MITRDTQRFVGSRPAAAFGPVAQIGLGDAALIGHRHQHIAGDQRLRIEKIIGCAEGLDFVDGIAVEEPDLVGAEHDDRVPVRSGRRRWGGEFVASDEPAGEDCCTGNRSDHDGDDQDPAHEIVGFVPLVVVPPVVSIGVASTPAGSAPPGSGRRRSTWRRGIIIAGCGRLRAAIGHRTRSYAL